MNCSGTGNVSCKTCDRTGKVRIFVQLKVKFDTHFDDFVSNKTSLEDQDIKQVHGVSVLDEVVSKVFPLNGFPENDVTEGSRRIIEKHNTIPFQRMIKQKQKVKVVPTALVKYDYKDKETGRFIVYGNQGDVRVDFDSYPQSCCWSTSCVII